jgi:hypothetical protein
MDPRIRIQCHRSATVGLDACFLCYCSFHLVSNLSLHSCSLNACFLHFVPRCLLPVFYSFTHLSSVVDRHRVDAEPIPDPTFQFDADTEPDPTPDFTDVGKAELF